MMTKNSDSSPFHVLDNVITNSNCQKLINFFPLGVKTYRSESQTIDSPWFERTITCERIDPIKFPNVKRIIYETETTVSDFIKNQLKLNLQKQGAQLVVWPEKSSQSEHVDTYFNDTRMSAIVYLNEGFKGGETFLPKINLNYTPEIGKALLFDGGSVTHGVKPITRGTRYTLSFWFN